MLHGVQVFFSAPAHADVLWFVLGASWAALICEYRAFRRRLKLVAHIRALDTELHVSEEELFESEKAYRNVRLALLELLASRAAHTAGREAAE